MIELEIREIHIHTARTRGSNTLERASGGHLVHCSVYNAFLFSKNVKADILFTLILMSFFVLGFHHNHHYLPQLLISYVLKFRALL